MPHRYSRELLNFLARFVGDRHAAADLAQESYVRVLAAQQAGQTVRDPRALLYRTARNLVIDNHRRAEVRAQVGERATGDEGPDLDGLAGPQSQEPEAILSSRQELAAIVATIEKLPPRCRETFILHKFDDLSYREIADRMGVSVRTVEMQLQIAMQACWSCLDEMDGMASDARTRERRNRRNA